MTLWQRIKDFFTWPDFDAYPARPEPRLKFLEGTEWLCPHCRTVLAVARRDIHSGDLKASSDWDIKDAGFWVHRHCGRAVHRQGHLGQIEFFTPTGWHG